MKYIHHHDTGSREFEARNDAEAQTEAREFLRRNHLVPQRRKNYLLRLWCYVMFPNRPGQQWIDVPI